MPRLIQIASAPAKGIPKRPKVTAGDLPKGSVRQPGESGYGGPRMQGRSLADRRRAALYANAGESIRQAHIRLQGIDRKVGGQALAIGAGSAALYGGLTPIARSQQREQAASNRAKARRLSKAWEDGRVFHHDAPGIRGPERRGKAHVVTGAPKAAGRLGRIAAHAGRHPALTLAAATGGLVAGPAVLIGGTRDTTRDLKASARELSAARRARRGQVASTTGRKQVVGKALYQREESLSPVRAAGLTAGAILATYGIGHSKMVGRGITRGVKMAQRGEYHGVADALARANAARGSIRTGMAPGEAAIRRIRALDDAIERVPRAIRPEVALVAGTMLASRSMPVQRTNYRQVSTPVY